MRRDHVSHAARGRGARRITAEAPGHARRRRHGAHAGAGRRRRATPVRSSSSRRGSIRAVVDYCLEHGIPVFPGVCTPTEIEAALEHGLTHGEVLSGGAEWAGSAFLKAIAAPYGDVSFMPTGGINAANVASYLAFKRVVACGGSWMAPADWIAAKQFDRIRRRVAPRNRRRARASAHGGDRV